MFSIWDLYATVYDSLPKHFKPYQELVKEIVNDVGKHSGKGRVLDAGCGTGNYSIALANNDYDVIGIDSSISMLKRAEKKRQSINAQNIQFQRLNITEKLPYPDNHFDCVISIHCLYTIKETKSVLSEYFRVLNPIGIFILSENQRPISIIHCLKDAKRKYGLGNAVSVFYNLFLLGIIILIIGERQVTGFYHYWNESELREILSEIGFDIISIKETYTNNTDLLVISTKGHPTI